MNAASRFANLGHRCAGVFRAAAEAFGGLLFPPRCHGCGVGEILADEPTNCLAAWLCVDCRAAADGERIEDPVCAVCSAPCDGAIVGPGEFTCANCRGRQFAFTRAFAARRSRGVVHDAVVRFKYRGDFALRRPLAAWLAESLELACKVPGGMTLDALVPVPLHAARRRERGFNQAAVLAELVGRTSDLPVWDRCLQRVRRTETQMRLDRDGRQSNLRGAFVVPRPAEVRGRRLLLVDDVFTTGATAHECARTLRQAGAAEVNVIVVGRR